MKKTLTLILIFVLLVSCAFAEGTQTFVSDTGLFTFEYPADYLALSDSDVAEILADPDRLKVLADSGMDTEFLAGMDFSNCECVYAADFVGNMNISCQPDSGLTPELMALLENELVESVKQQYRSMGVTEDDMHYYGILSIGENRFLTLELIFLGNYMVQCLTADANGNIYLLTFTEYDTDAMMMTLESFKTAVQLADAAA